MNKGSAFYTRLLYITTVGLILSNVFTLVLAYAMVTGITNSIYESSNSLQVLRTEARTPLQYDDNPNAGPVGGGGSGTVGSGNNFCSLCDDSWKNCQKFCLKYPEGSSIAIECLSICQQQYQNCRAELC